MDGAPTADAEAPERFDAEGGDTAQTRDDAEAFERASARFRSERGALEGPASER